MKRYAPLLTLAAIAVLGVGLFLFNIEVGGERQQAEVNAAAAAETPVPTGAPAEPAAATTEPAAEPAPEPPAVVEVVYAGRSSGDEVTVAVAVKDGRAVGYVCDGEQIEVWVEGTLEGDQLSLRSGDGQTTVAGTVDETAAFGNVAVAGTQWPYSAKAVEAPGGLYSGRANIRGVAARIGWIVEGDGRVTGLARAEGSQMLLPAPPLDPAAPDQVQVDGAAVTVTVIDGDATVVNR
jgi:hypothetical protein